MRETLPNNNKSFIILNQLISKNHYEGSISKTRIEFVRKKFRPNCYRVIRVLNDENKFVLRFDYKFPMNIAAKVTVVFGIFVSIISLVKGNWLFALAFFVIPFAFIFLTFHSKKNKEIELFTSKFLELYNSEYEN